MSYSQILFVENKILAGILLIVSFIDWWTGLSGVIVVVTAIILATILGYDKSTIHKGLFSFNPLLVGLGVGTYFSPAIEVVILLIIASSVAFFSSVFLMGILKKYGLPFLSLPFLLGMWLLLLSFPALSNIQLNEENLFPSNQLFKLGGATLVEAADGINYLFEGSGLDTYFISLGAIFFQFSILAGVLIAVGLLIHSRVHFLFSLIGFFVAYWMYSFLGVYSGSLNYTYYGFNFILSAIAIGGYFLIPSRQSLLWSLLIIPILVITTIGSDRLFSVFGLSVFSLPFNIVVIGILYAFKIRYNQTKGPILTSIQNKNPETNAYLFHSMDAKEYSSYIFSIHLPFLGEWTINQGHNGAHTHREFYKYAWDFIVKDAVSQKEFINDGSLTTDYYCFNKPVVAAANGTVVAIVNIIEDNEIGISNIHQNWGNTVVLKHDTYLFSKMSHLKKGSVKVNIGDSVIQGQEIGKCGNSGRSPYPHLHFQLQSLPVIGSPSCLWPISDFIEKKNTSLNFVQKGVPTENSVLSNIQTASILESSFKWNPGDKFHLKQLANTVETTYLIENKIDIFNQTYLYCPRTRAKLYYANNGKKFEALNYVGSKKSPLFYFFYSFYRLVFCEQQLSVKTNFPVHQLYQFPLITLQDFIVPFAIFLKGSYCLEYGKTDELFNVKKMILHSTITGTSNHKFFSSEIEILKSKDIFINCHIPNKSNIQLSWEKILD